MMKTETELVVALIREVGVSRLGNWDGCCCSSFSVRNVSVDVSCGKGCDKQSARVYSASMDYDDKNLLKPIMAEVVRQCEEQSGRGGKFAELYEPWSK